MAPQRDPASPPNSGKRRIKFAWFQPLAPGCWSAGMAWDIEFSCKITSFDTGTGYNPYDRYLRQRSCNAAG